MEGCDILLDVNQVFVRQGTLIQVLIKHILSKLYFAFLRFWARSRGLGAGGGSVWCGGRSQTGRPSDSNNNSNDNKINIYKMGLYFPRCFLFSNHLLVTTRTHAGRLHLVEGVGRISLAEVSLIEDPSDEERIDEGESSE